MPAKDTVVLILAAGKGTRLRSNVAKVLHRAGGRTLVEHVVRAALALKPAEVVVVVGHQAENVAAVVEELGAKAVLQNPQRGTGHAVQVARRAIRRSAKYLLIVPGDAPLLRPATLQALLDTHRSGGAAATILTARLEDPTDYGRVIFKQDSTVARIVEEKAASEEERAVNIVNSSIYCFTLAKLWPVLAALQPENVHKELYLTDAIALLNEHRERVLAVSAEDSNEIWGCNTRAHLAEVDRFFRQRKAEELMEAGVTIYLPETVIIDAAVSVGQDTIIEPAVQLLGATKIGAGCTIRTGTVISNSTVDDGALIEPHCVITDSRVGPEVQLGPFARLRPGADLRKGSKAGNFVEIKKSIIHEGAKVPHLTYIGDATVGAKANIGAGTITCNYNGYGKFPTVIGKRAFIGSDTTLVAPVRIGDGAYVGAGSTITENVPADALAIARGRQANKPGWAAAKRAEMEKSGKGHGSHSSKSSPSKSRKRKSPKRRAKSRSRR
jgi:bifunctional UDP-N-acetylglucosamine pyrophosphorylase / glucosamine-1-phosphate N-acetyltransferase